MFHARICCLLFVQVLCTGTRRRLASFAHHVHVNVILLLFCLSQVTCSHSCSRFAVLLSFRANVHYSTRMLVRLALCLGKCVRTCNWCVVVVVFGAFACQLLFWTCFLRLFAGVCLLFACRVRACACLLLPFQVSVVVVCLFVECFALALVRRLASNRTTFTLTLSFCCFVWHRSLARRVLLSFCCCVPVSCKCHLSVLGLLSHVYLTLLCLGSRTRSSAEAFASIVEID